MHLRFWFPLFLTVLFALSGQQFGYAGPRPNIIYIYADDLGYGEVGAYGQQKIRTPNIDQLAAEGMRFTQHYTGAPVCAPARCSLLTGRHGGHAYIRHNREVQPEGQHPIPAEEITITELLKANGYVTACIGKWGLGYPGSEGDPNSKGFDLFFGYNCQRHAHSYYPAYLWRNDERVPLNNNPPVPGHARLPRGADPHDPASYEQFKGQDHASDRLIEEALGFMRDNQDKPFFLYYPSPLPHVALHVPDDELKPYLALGWEETPHTRGGYTPHMTPRAAYAAMITKLDTEVGRIMQLLKALDIDDNTLVIFSSDNGPTHLGSQVDVRFFNSTAGLRGLKGSLYEGGIRVPMIARWPGRIEPGSVTDHPSYQVDIMATLMDVIGRLDAVPEDRDGISFLPTLLGRDEKQASHKYMVWEFHGYQGQQAIRMGDWKGVRRNIHQGNLEIELYNLADDPRESRNVADDHPQIVRRIEAAMREQRRHSDIFRFQTLEDGLE